MAEDSEKRLTQAQAHDLAQILKPIPKKVTGDKLWDRLLLLMNKGLWSPRYRRTPKRVVPVAVFDRVLDAMAQRLMDTYPEAPDPVTEQRIGEISDAIRDARDYLRGL